MILSIDTSVLVAAERGDARALASFAAWGTDSTLVLSSIALAEWMRGSIAVKDPGKRARARRFYEDVLRHLAVQPFSEEDAIEFGRTLGELQAKGVTVDFADGLIASQALNAGIPVATFNVAHFSKIPGLQVVDPNEKAPGGDAGGRGDRE